MNESADARRQLAIADYAFVSADGEVRPGALAGTREYADVPPLPSPAWLPYTARWRSSGR